VFDRAVVQCGVNVLHRNTNADRHALASLLGGRHSSAALYQRCRSTERRPRIDETVFAPFSTVYGSTPRRENTVPPSFWRDGHRKHRGKTAKTVETVGR